MDEQALKDKALKAEIRLKLCNFCAYQERSPRQIKRKMDRLALPESWQEEFMDFLAKEGFYDPFRFTTAFVRSRFNQKAWGRLKIRQKLIEEGVEPQVIDAALDQLADDSYDEKIEDLARKKWISLKTREKDLQKRKQKTFRFLLQKGFESSLVWKAIAQVENEA